MNDIIRKTLHIVFSSTRPMPAYYTSDYNKETGKYTKPKNFCVNFSDINPTDEYELASFVWHELPSSDLYNRGEHMVSSLLIIAEDVILGSFIISRLRHEILSSNLTRYIIEKRLFLFENKGYKSDILLSDRNIREYIYKCEQFGKNRAKLNYKGNDDLQNTGLAFTDNENFGIYYAKLRN